MATIEERLQAIEQEHQALEREHTQLKKTIELQTIAIRALVSKEAFEKLQNTVESLKLDFERQEKRIIHFERQTNDQFTELKEDTATIKEQLALVVTMLRRTLPPEEQR